jgi:hypothetical protein
MAVIGCILRLISHAAGLRPEYTLNTPNQTFEECYCTVKVTVAAVPVMLPEDPVIVTL